MSEAIGILLLLGFIVDVGCGVDGCCECGVVDAFNL